MTPRRSPSSGGAVLVSPDQWNGMLDESTRSGRMMLAGRVSYLNTPSGPVAYIDDTPEAFNPSIVYVQNKTSETVKVGGVLGLDKLITTNDELNTLQPLLVWEGKAATTAMIKRRQFAVLADDAAADGAPVKAYVGGIFPAKVNFSSDDNTLARINYEDPDTEALVAHSGYGEFRVIARLKGEGGGDTTGIQWALVTPFEVVPFVGYLTQDGGQDGNATTAATWTYTVKDQFGLELDTEVALERARPIGKMNKAGNGSRGLVAYELGGDGPDLILLDAYGEYPGATKSCES